MASSGCEKGKGYGRLIPLACNQPIGRLRRWRQGCDFRACHPRIPMCGKCADRNLAVKCRDFRITRRTSPGINENDSTLRRQLVPNIRLAETNSRQSAAADEHVSIKAGKRRGTRPVGKDLTLFVNNALPPCSYQEHDDDAGQNNNCGSHVNSRCRHSLRCLRSRSHPEDGSYPRLP